MLRVQSADFVVVESFETDQRGLCVSFKEIDLDFIEVSGLKQFDSLPKQLYDILWQILNQILNYIKRSFCNCLVLLSTTVPNLVYQPLICWSGAIC